MQEKMPGRRFLFILVFNKIFWVASPKQVDGRTPGTKYSLTSAYN